ncbi:MAG: helix-turn-helix transcriptional regulator [Prevotella sp.]|nr:helix-turn-helix transcriptional regulator [Prevotella sp.]MDY5684693.1 helix-turn-helix transcriptional regulator [Prevotella sp.]
MNDIKNRITKRELQILDLLSRGMSSNEIAAELFISHNTVDFHRRQLLKKTDSKNIADLIGNAYRLGILPM